jgi:hypothetical protein
VATGRSGGSSGQGQRGRKGMGRKIGREEGKKGGRKGGLRASWVGGGGRNFLFNRYGLFQTVWNH